MSDYVWRAFDANEALNGTFVGLQNLSDDSDLSNTGALEINDEYREAMYKASLGGTNVWCDLTGKITVCPTDNPETPAYIGQTMKLVTASLDQTKNNKFTRAGGERTISSANPRDQFAMEILNAIIQKQDNPAAFDDAAMLRTTQTAYRWANAMMEAAADNRYADTDASNQGASSEDVAAAISGDLKIKNATNTQLVVKGNANYPTTGTPDFTDVLNVNIVAGGGGGGGNVDVDTMPALTGTISIGNGGLGSSSSPLYMSMNKDAATEMTATDRISHIAAFCFDNYGKSLVRVEVGRLGVPILTEISAFPTAANVGKGCYYRYSSSFGENGALSSVAINLPTVSSPTSGVVNIVIFNFKCSSATFSVTSSSTVRFRGSNPGSSLAAGIYEIDCVDNGMYWTVGVTAIVDSQ